MTTTLSGAGTYAGADPCSGGTAADYSFTYVPGATGVTKATLTVTASATSTSYGTAPTVTPGYVGFENGQGTGVGSTPCRRARPRSRR